MLSIRHFHPDDAVTVVELALEACEPVFDSMAQTVGPEIFRHLFTGEWRSHQEADIRRALSSYGVSVAVTTDEVVGNVTVDLPTGEPHGEIYTIAVAPEQQGRRVGKTLTDHAVDQIRAAGRALAIVETGGDPGPAAARATYEKAGFVSLPAKRYFLLLWPTPPRSGVRPASFLGPGVEGGGTSRRRLGFLPVRTCGHGGFHPGGTAAFDEASTVLRCRPGHELLGVHRFGPRLEMEDQAEKSEVPADTGGSGTELRPPLVGDVGDMFEGEPGLTGSLLGYADLDPGDLSPELPRRCETVRRIALFHRPVGIAFEAVATTDLEVAADGQEPAGDPLGIGAGVPEVSLVGGIHPTHRHHPRLPGFEHPGTDRTADIADVVGYIDGCHLLLPLSLTSRHLGGQSLERTGPQSAEPLEPFIGFPEGVGTDRVEPLRAIPTHLREPALPEYPEVMRHRRLGDTEPLLDGVGDVTGRPFSTGQLVEDAAPDRVAEDVERVHTS